MERYLFESWKLEAGSWKLEARSGVDFYFQLPAFKLQAA